MQAEDLYNRLTTDMGISTVHPLHKLMIEECCESVLKNTTDQDYRTLKLTVQTAFLTSNAMLKGLLKASLTVGDIINFNYRGQTFVINKDSPLLQD